MSHSKARKIALNRGDRAVRSGFVFWLGQEEDPEGEGGELLGHLLGGAVGEFREPLGDERQEAPGEKLGDNVDLPRGHGGVQVPQVRLQGAGELVVEETLHEGVLRVQEEAGIFLLVALEVFQNAVDAVQKGGVGPVVAGVDEVVHKLLDAEEQEVGLVLKMGIERRPVDPGPFADVLHAQVGEGFFAEQIDQGRQQEAVGALDAKVF